MHKSFFIFLFFLSTALYGQKDSVQKGWAVTLSAASIPIGQPGFGIQPGVEYRFNDRYSLLAEVAFRANKKNNKDSSILGKQYLRFKCGLRYSFPGKKERWSHDYAGLQISWATRKFINTNGFYDDHLPGDTVYYYSKASINSPVTTISLQFGSIITEGKFAVDAFIGLGARFIHTTISNIENPFKQERQRGGSGLNLTASYSYAGNVTMFHINGGIRFMWHFYNFRHPQKR
ncbi:MAG TPA: hypothetical protein VN451_00290 [Chitinophagaceae bacterium]|nr:hypothetical protein [Chitinophagaceae bacterium]